MLMMRVKTGPVGIAESVCEGMQGAREVEGSECSAGRWVFSMSMTKQRERNMARIANFGGHDRGCASGSRHGQQVWHFSICHPCGRML